MFNEAHVSLVGYVVGEPSYSRVGKNKTPKLALRVCWATRRRDSATGEWVDGNRSFVNVNCWRQLAENASICLRRGDPVVVKGRLDVRTFMGRDGQRKTAVDVEAYALGPDLNHGVASFRRVWPPSGKTAGQQAAESAAGIPADDDEAALAAGAGLPDGGADVGDAVADAADAAGEEIFDDSAIDALAQETGSLTAPF
ncbi:MAG TPA: single-stranded DNA-binding protein [Streptosporangiaceae bacterium]|nr:single-stranded DNA-binding protein [Streptosporangiaceae bacterium]